MKITSMNTRETVHPRIIIMSDSMPEISIVHSDDTPSTKLVNTKKIPSIIFVAGYILRDHFDNKTEAHLREEYRQQKTLV